MRVRAGFKAWAALGAAVVSMATAGAAERASATVVALSPDAHALLQWARQSGDTTGKPHAVVDKRHARIWVFDRHGQLAGTTPVLLGLASGDDSAPGVGTRVLSGIPASERTTPAGRFASEPGHNLKGEGIVWVDYEAAFAIHRLRPAPAHERRPERLASESPADNRISLGCVIVGEDFYDRVIAPTLGRQRGVVYVLPEVRSMHAVFGALPADSEM